MDTEQQLIVDTTRRIMIDLCDKQVVDAAESGSRPERLWRALEESGLTLAGIPGDFSGSDGTMADSMLIIREAAAFAAPIPLAETFIAASLLSVVGERCPKGPISVASGNVVFERTEQGVRLAGQVQNITFATQCDHLLLVNQNSICLIPTVDIEFVAGVNLAGEACCQLEIDQTVEGAVLAESGTAVERLLHLGAISRANMMAGAMTSILNMTVKHALQREQFGRPISRFQAIQQQLAVLAGEVAACQRAANSVLHEPTGFDIAVAKARIGEAVSIVTDIAHQVHGAMGYTLDHELNLHTRRLWTWRDDYGNETYWQKTLGRQLCRSGADNLWASITEAG